MLIEIYSDGSGNTFDSDGGYGWRLIVDGAVVDEGSGYLNSATNNVAELTAAIEGLRAADGYISKRPLQLPDAYEVVLVSDSQLVLGYASGRYQCKALHLTSLYIQLRKLYGSVKASGRWVKGHSGNEHNEACDKLAKAGRESEKDSLSEANSEFVEAQLQIKSIDVLLWFLIQLKVDIDGSAISHLEIIDYVGKYGAR